MAFRFAPVLFALTLALPLAAVPGARAQCTTSWTNPAGGAWTDAANWSDGLPGVTDDACITLAGTYTVTAASVHVLRLTLGGASGTQTLQTTSSLTLDGPSTIGPNGAWEWTAGQLAGAGTLTNDGAILITGTSSRSINLDLVNEGTLAIPGALLGTGSLTNEAGALVEVTAAGNANVDVPLFVNRGTIRKSAGTGTVRIRSGTFLNEGGAIEALAGTLIIGATGADHAFQGATLHAAAGATLAFAQSAGSLTWEGVVTGTPEGSVGLVQGVGGGTIAAGPAGATLALGGTGFTWSAGRLGSAGGAWTNTGLVAIPGGTLGLDAATLTNEGTIRHTGGTLQLQGGTLVNAAAGVYDFDGDGRISSSGTFVNQGLFRKSGGTGVARVGPLAFDNVAGGVVSAESGTMRFEWHVGHEPGALIRGTATFEPSRPTVQNPDIAFTHGGNVGPGLSVGTLTWGGDFEPEASAELIVEVGAGGVHDELVVTEDAVLGGVLRVRVLDGYTPQVGDAFTVLTAGAVTGAFAQVLTENPANGLVFAAETIGATVRVTAVEGGGAVTVFPDAFAHGDRREVQALGAGVEAVTAARLVCTTCLDPAGHGTVVGEVVAQAPGVLTLAFDLTAARYLGYYDLVLERPGQPDLRVPVTVRPFVSFPLVEARGTVGVAVRPSGYNWSELRITNASNVDEPAFPLVRLTMPEAPAVRVRLSSAWHGAGATLYDRETAGSDQARVFYRLTPQREVGLTMGAAVAPAAVRFPDEAPEPEHQVAFGAPVPFLFDAAGALNLPLGQMAASLVAGLRDSGDPNLDAYIAQVEAQQPGLLEATARQVLLTYGGPGAAARGGGGAGGGLLGVCGGVLDALAQAVPGAPPSGGGACDCAATTEAVNTADELLAAIQESMAHGLDALVAAEVTSACPPPPPPGGPEMSCFLVEESTQAVLDAGRQCERRVDQVLGGDEGDGADACDDGPDVARCEWPPRWPPPPPPCEGETCVPLYPRVRGPFDPNDKTTQTDLACEFGTVIVDGEPVPRCVRYFVPLARRDEPITYTIAFENQPQATAPAEDVVITDVLDADLDPATLEVLATSSDSTFSYAVAGQVVTFRFDDVHLPPNVNAPEGQGFVQFRVRPRPGLPDGIEISNSASIVFDFNPPIATPAVVHEVAQVADPRVFALAPDSAGVGLPFAVTIPLLNRGPDPAPEAALTIALSGVTGEVVAAVPSAGSCQVSGASAACAFGTLAAGDSVAVALTLRATQAGTLDLLATAMTAAEDAVVFDSEVRAAIGVSPTVAAEDDGALPAAYTLAPNVPNPFEATTTLRFGLPEPARVRLTVYDVLGREVARLADDAAPRPPGWHRVGFDARGLAAGLYLYRLEAVGGGAPFVEVRRMLLVR